MSLEFPLQRKWLNFHHPMIGVILLMIQKYFNFFLTFGYLAQRTQGFLCSFPCEGVFLVKEFSSKAFQVVQIQTKSDDSRLLTNKLYSQSSPSYPALHTVLSVLSSPSSSSLPLLSLLPPLSVTSPSSSSSSLSLQFDFSCVFLFQPLLLRLARTTG